VGSLEVGKIADILVLTQNLLDNVMNTPSLKYVVADGIVYDAETAGVVANRADQTGGSWPTYQVAFNAFADRASAGTRCE